MDIVFFAELKWRCLLSHIYTLYHFIQILYIGCSLFYK